MKPSQILTEIMSAFFDDKDRSIMQKYRLNELISARRLAQVLERRINAAIQSQIKEAEQE